MSHRVTFFEVTSGKVSCPKRAAIGQAHLCQESGNAIVCIGLVYLRLTLALFVDFFLTRLRGILIVFAVQMTEKLIRYVSWKNEAAIISNETKKELRILIQASPEGSGNNTECDDTGVFVNMQTRLLLNMGLVLARSRSCGNVPHSAGQLITVPFQERDHNYTQEGRWSATLLNCLLVRFL